MTSTTVLSRALHQAQRGLDAAFEAYVGSQSAENLATLNSRIADLQAAREALESERAARFGRGHRAA
jgi:hypothetical protein